MRPRPTPWLLPALGGALVLLVLAGLALHVPGADSVGSLARVNLFVLVLALAAGAYLAACAVVLRRPGTRVSLTLVLAVGILMRLPVLAAPPFLSSDLFRYVWDGRVQRAGINPYRYIPADPQLAGLRDQAIYPHVNRRGYAPTIYPPTAQLLFRAIASVSQTPLAVKAAMVLCEAVAVLCLLRLLALAALPSSLLLIYAWNPLAVWCFAGNGHVDAASVALVALALLCRATRRDGWAGVALGAAVLVKFLPAAIAPALWRWRWRLPLAAAATMALLYGYYAGVGWRVLGFLGAYGNEEGRGGNGLWALAGLARLGLLPDHAVPIYAGLVALLLGGLALAVGLPRCDPSASGRDDITRVAGQAGLLAGATLLLLSPHYPWYFPYLAVFATLSGSMALIWMSVSPLVLYLSPWHEFFLWPSIIYVPTLILALAGKSRP